MSDIALKVDTLLGAQRQAVCLLSEGWPLANTESCGLAEILPSRHLRGPRNGKQRQQKRWDSSLMCNREGPLCAHRRYHCLLRPSRPGLYPFLPSLHPPADTCKLLHFAQKHRYTSQGNNRHSTQVRLGFRPGQSAQKAASLHQLYDSAFPRLA